MFCTSFFFFVGGSFLGPIFPGYYVGKIIDVLGYEASGMHLTSLVLQVGASNTHLPLQKNPIPGCATSTWGGFLGVLGASMWEICVLFLGMSLMIQSWCNITYMGVSQNRGTPKSSILIGFSIINNPFWGTPNFGNTHIVEIEPVHDIGSYYGSMIDNVLIDVELLQLALNVKVVLLWSCFFEPTQKINMAMEHPPFEHSTSQLFPLGSLISWSVGGGIPEYIYDMYDIYDISLGQMSREVCQPMCFVCSYMLVAKLTHVTTTSKICVLGDESRAQARFEALLMCQLEAVRCDHAKDRPRSLCEMGDNVNQDRSKWTVKNVFEYVRAIRRSGHRGTSALNWLINFCCWVCAILEEPTEALLPDQTLTFWWMVRGGGLCSSSRETTRSSPCALGYPREMLFPTKEAIFEEWYCDPATFTRWKIAKDEDGIPWRNARPAPFIREGRYILLGAVDHILTWQHPSWKLKPLAVGTWQFCQDVFPKHGDFQRSPCQFSYLGCLLYESLPPWKSIERWKLNWAMNKKRSPWLFKVFVGDEN